MLANIRRFASGLQNGNVGLKQLQKRNIRIYGFINNHYAGFAPETVWLFNELWAE
jgi:hypothetical protein